MGTKEMESVGHLSRAGFREETDKIVTGSKIKDIMFLSLARILEFLNDDSTFFIHLLDTYEVLLCAKHSGIC